jgi:hypothetical protein
LLTRLAITVSLGAAALLALAALVSVPGGVGAARTIAAADDPARIADLALDKQFNAAVATHEIEEALAAGDIELARSFVDLAADRQVALPAELTRKIEAAEQDAATASSQAAGFARGFVTGKPEDIASAAEQLHDRPGLGALHGRKAGEFCHVGGALGDLQAIERAAHAGALLHAADIADELDQLLALLELEQP